MNVNDHMKDQTALVLQAAISVIDADIKALVLQYKTDTDAMKSVMFKFGLMESKVNEHEVSIKNLDVLVVRGNNGTPSMVDDIRAIKGFQQSIKFWLTAIALGFLGQGVVMFMAILIWLIQKVFVK